MWVHETVIARVTCQPPHTAMKVVHNYAEMADRVSRIAGSLRNNLGMQQGDRLALLMKNCVEYTECIFGLGTAVSRQCRSTRSSIQAEQSTSSRTGSKVCIATADLADEIRNTNIDGLERLIVIGDKDHAALLDADAIPMVETNADDLARLLYQRYNGAPEGCDAVTPEPCDLFMVLHQ